MIIYLIFFLLGLGIGYVISDFMARKSVDFTPPEVATKRNTHTNESQAQVISPLKTAREKQMLNDLTENQ